MGNGAPRDCHHCPGPRALFPAPLRLTLSSWSLTPGTWSRVEGGLQGAWALRATASGRHVPQGLAEAPRLGVGRGGGPWCPPPGKERPRPVAQEGVGSHLQMHTNPSPHSGGNLGTRNWTSRWVPVCPPCNSRARGAGSPPPGGKGGAGEEAPHRRGGAAPFPTQASPPLPPRRKSCTRGSGTRTCSRT